MVHFSKGELDELKQKLLTMLGHAEAAVERALKALVDRDDTLAHHITDDDSILDKLEIEIDELSIKLLAKGPEAADLRFITVAMKISHDLERVGDEATTIALRAIELNTEPQLKPYIDIPRMGETALQMLQHAMEAFVDRDTAKARALIPCDKVVDGINKQLHRELASFMVENPATINRCLHLMVISKSLERIADHATNVAEEVVYLCEGRDIRHSPEAKRGIETQESL
jgi:phosphate transport system protein